MASGASVVEVIEVMTPATSAAELKIRTGGSSPAERVPVYAFDAASIEYIDFKCRLIGYSGGGLTFTLPWSAASATTNAVRWGLALRRVQDDAEDIDTSQTYDFNSVDDTTASASGEISYPTIAFTDGADMDSTAEGELFILRCRREANHANDTMTGDAELWAVWGKET